MLTFKSLHSCDNELNVNSAVAIFQETTIVACESYFPDRADMSNFLRLISCWWTTSNSRKKLTHHFWNNAVILNDGKNDFYKRLSDWIESKQTSKAFVITGRTGYAYARTFRWRVWVYFHPYVSRDPLENIFSQYQPMSGGRFLVSLWEVLSTERKLTCRSLLKQNINFWKENLKPVQKNDRILNILAKYESKWN